MHRCDCQVYGKVRTPVCSAISWRAVAPSLSDITLIFDKGNNAADNLQAVAAAGLHFIDSLVPTQHPDLLAIAPSELVPIDGFPAVRVKRLKKTVYGAERTVLVTLDGAT
jgi:hypothetical protein